MTSRLGRVCGMPIFKDKLEMLMFGIFLLIVYLECFHTYTERVDRDLPSVAEWIIAFWILGYKSFVKEFSTHT